MERSEISVQAETLAAAGIRGIEERAGSPAVSGEVHYMGEVQLADGSEPPSLLARNHSNGFRGASEVRIIAGSFPGLGEVLVGRLAYRALDTPSESLQVGNQIGFEGQSLTISGNLTPGTVMESEIWFGRRI